MIFQATTKDGRLHIKERISFESYLRDLDGKEIIVAIEHTLSKRRTVEQNSLYFGILRKIMVVLIDRGYDNLNVVALNGYFRGLFLRDVIIDPVTGKDIEIERHTSDLNTKEYVEHIDKVTRFALQDMNIESKYLEPYISMMK